MQTLSEAPPHRGRCGGSTREAEIQKNQESLDKATALPVQIYNLASAPQDELRQAASAAIVLLLVLILVMNGLAIFIRNKFQRSW